MNFMKECYITLLLGLEITTEITTTVNILTRPFFILLVVTSLSVSACSFSSRISSPEQDARLPALDPVASALHEKSMTADPSLPLEEAVKEEVQPKIPPLFEFRDTGRVRYFINEYLTKRRPFLDDALLRGDEYLPMMRRVFVRAGLPAELANIAIIESRLRPKAKSRSGAVGLWQFMRRTAKHCGLKVSFYKDERKDPVKSTIAATKYFKELNTRFDDWMLAIASYNSGPTRVARIIKREGTRDFFELSERGVFNKETDDFVHKFIAVSLILRHSELFGFVN